MEITLAWWVLLTLGVLLIISEMTVGGFVVVWFGIGAIMASAVTFLSPGLNLGIQLLLSVLFGAVLLYMFRDRFVGHGANEANRLQTFEANDARLVINSGSDDPPQVFCNGTHWHIGNPDSIPESPQHGQKVRVEHFEGNRAFIQAMPSDNTQ